MASTEKVPTAKGGGRKNAITGIEAKHLARDVMLAALKEMKVEYDEAATDEQLSVLIFGKYQPLLNKDKLECERCHGVSYADLDVCPYCGHDGGGIELEPIEESTKEETMTTTAQETTKANGKLAKTDDTKASSALRTARDLDVAVDKVRKAKAESLGGYWHLGKLIAEIYDSHIWTLRTEKDAKGKDVQRWKSFEAFCQTELDLSISVCRNLMEVSRKYSEPQVRALGYSKLALILRAPEVVQPKLLKEAEKGASAREVKAAVNKALKEHGDAPTRTPHRSGTSTSRDTSKATKASKASAEAASKRKGTITVASIIGAQTLPCFKRAAVTKEMLAGEVSFAKVPRAKRIADEPVARLELANNVYMLLTVKASATGEFSIKVDTRRED